MRTRLLLVALLAMLAASVAAPAQGDAAAAARAKGKRVLVSPRAGQVVRSHHVRLRVRSRTLTDTLRVQLNGTAIGNDFGRPRHGVRTLLASLSHGLRRGRNVLRVTVRSRRGAVRTTRVRFVVRTRKHLVGAGRDLDLAVDGKAQIRGTVRTKPSGDDGAKLRWRVVRAPRHSAADAALLGGAAPHTLTSPDGRSASIVPRVPGRYTLRLSAGGGSRAASDSVSVDVTLRNRLVPIETMTATDREKSDRRGVRVGETTYLLREARGFTAAQQNDLQVVVLKRTTLEFVSNTTYPVPDGRDADLSHLKADLAGLGAGDLVIVALQPNSRWSNGFSFDGVLGRIGVANSGGVVLLPGELSAIGVPGMGAGDADINVTVKDPAPRGGNFVIRQAPMQGYLTPDQWGNYGFVPKERVTFTFGPKPPSPCPGPCLDSAGLRIRHLDARTLAPAAHDGQFYPMHYDDSAPKQLAADLEAMPEDDVVMIEAVSTGYKSFPPVGSHDRATMVALANAIAKVGGTRNAFNRIARRFGSDANGGMTYALVGWKGAGEGAGAEVAAGVDGEGDAPSLSVALRPDRQSLFRPVEESGAPDSLTDLVMEEPTTKWPLDDEPRAKAALSWLGSYNVKLSSDPRADYRSQLLDQAGWDAIAAAIETVPYTKVPDDKRNDFTEAEFLKARGQLVKELRWVGNVRSYLTNLSSPISGSEVLSYSTVQRIATDVHKEAEPPDDETTMRWLEFTEILLELAGPITHEVSSTIAGVMELGTWMFAADDKGGPVEDLPFKASEIGDELVAHMKQSVEMYRRMGDVIVTDPAKLAFVGENGACSSNSAACPRGWSFSEDDKTRVESDLQRSVERMAWEELLPLAFTVYGLNPQRLEHAPDPRWYNCGTYPFWYYSDTAVSLATTPLLWELDPQNAKESQWKLLVLAKPGGAEKYFHAQTVSDGSLQRVFGPVADTTTPGMGGLAVSLARLLPAKQWKLWAGTPWFRPVEDACS